MELLVVALDVPVLWKAYSMNVSLVSAPLTILSAEGV